MQPNMHTVTLSSRSTTERLVINIPVADERQPATAADVPPSTTILVSPHLDDHLSLSFPPFATDPSSSSTSFSNPAADPESSAVPSSPRLSSEQRRHRRRMKHRDIDATRRGREAAALGELEAALAMTDGVAPQAGLDSAARTKKKPKSKGAILAMAALRITQLHAMMTTESVALAHTAFFRSTSTQVAIFGPKIRRCVDANDAFCQFTGYSHHDLLQSRLAFCPAPPLRLTSAPSERPSAATGRGGVEQWEVDELGRTVPVPLEQLQHNWDQLQLLLQGARRKVLCTFRIALAGQRLTESQCELWLSGGPLTAPERCATTSRFIIVQTSADKYRPISS